MRLLWLLLLFPLKVFALDIPNDTTACTSPEDTVVIAKAFKKGGLDAAMETSGTVKDCFSFKGSVNVIRVSEVIYYFGDEMRIIMAGTVFEGSLKPTIVYIFLIKKGIAI